MVLFLLLISSISFSQNIKVYRLNENEKISIDGNLYESFWKLADSISNLKMVVPSEGLNPSERTTIKILSDNKNIYLGIKCYDSDAEKITSYSKSRDASFENEDGIKFIFDTFLDRRSGYIFAVNPTGTRYDALVSNFGESENPNWDGVWDAKTNIDTEGWTTEIIIPIQSLSFLSGSSEWGFNFERKIQRNLETDRWTGLKRDYKLGQVTHAGKITGLPLFDLGIGLTLKLSALGSTVKSFSENSHSELDFSADFTQKITSDISTQVTINTDFAETEVDTRRTNLTRFPLFFPEKRGFFLEGSDVFDFGIGLNEELVPFFSRRIGLYNGNKVPIIFGAKANGKFNNTNFGVLVTRTNKVDNMVSASSMGAFRLKQNILEESSLGVIGTFGDPEGKSNIWLLGLDFTYQTSKFLDDKNFLAGVWGIYNNNPDLKGDNSAFGLKIDYPNDLLDISFTAKKIGDTFSPSLGFVQRMGIISYRIGVEYMPRPDWGYIHQFSFESAFTLVTNLNHEWENYELFTAPINILFESGDKFEFNIVPTGENLPEDFEINDGVILKKGPYDWVRYRLEVETASKRVVSTEAVWWFGSFYDGYLDQIELVLALRPSNSINLSFNYEKNIAKLPAGNFTQDLFGGKLQFSFTPDFVLSSFIQYDSESKSIGTNTRIRWTFNMLGDLFIVYNHNVNRILNKFWQYESNQLIIKFSYGLWL